MKWIKLSCMLRWEDKQPPSPDRLVSRRPERPSSGARLSDSIRLSELRWFYPWTSSRWGLNLRSPLLVFVLGFLANREWINRATPVQSPPALFILFNISSVQILMSVLLNGGFSWAVWFVLWSGVLLRAKPDDVRGVYSPKHPPLTALPL